MPRLGRSKVVPADASAWTMIRGSCLVVFSSISFPLIACSLTNGLPASSGPAPSRAARRARGAGACSMRFA